MENSRIEISISEICYYLFFGILFFYRSFIVLSKLHIANGEDPY